MVSVADMYQGIKGVKFPASAEKLMNAIERKRGIGIFTDSEIDRMKDLLSGHEGQVFRNTANLAKLVQYENNQNGGSELFPTVPVDAEVWAPPSLDPE